MNDPQHERYNVRWVIKVIRISQFVQKISDLFFSQFFATIFVVSEF